MRYEVIFTEDGKELLGTFNRKRIDGRLTVYNADNRAIDEMLKEKYIKPHINGYNLYKNDKLIKRRDNVA